MSFTTTWIAGRFLVFKSTVPEIVPVLCSLLEPCAFAIGTHTIAIVLRKRIARNPAFDHHFLKFCNLHSISTCCALSRYFLWRLGGWGRQSVRRRTATSNSHFRTAVVVSPASFCTFSPSNQPSRAPTNAHISAPCMPNRPPTLSAFGYTLRPISSPSHDAASSFLSMRLSPSFPQVR